jgi:hypothetical protein
MPNLCFLKPLQPDIRARRRRRVSKAGRARTLATERSVARSKPLGRSIGPLLVSSRRLKNFDETPVGVGRRLL